MGYYLKTTNYPDLADLEKGVAATISSFLGSSTNSNLTSTDQNNSKADHTIFDLNLGRLSSTDNHSSINNNNGLDYTTSTRDHNRRSLSSMESSVTSSMPSKRSRAPSGSGGNQVVSCLVDGCISDLSKCRDYHRRHKVCEQHSKTPRVMIGGLEQRFCQQCSRFHSLGEFDEGKRSCRKRLEGHNRRRRKPQPDSLSVNPANFLSAAQGSRFLPYSNSSMLPSAATSVVSSTDWSAVKTEADPSSLIYNNTGRSELNVLSTGPQQRSLPPSQYAYTRARQFPFLQDSPPTLTASSTHQLFHDQIPASCNGPKNFFSGTPVSASSSPNGLNQVMDNNRALSLLSSSPSETTPEIGLGRMMQHSPNPLPPPTTARPLSTDLHYNSMGHYHHHHPGPRGLDAHGSSDAGATSLISNFFQSAGPDGPSSSEPHQTISFSWE